MLTRKNETTTRQEERKDPISGSQKDFDALKRKLISGKTLAVAAAEAGMTLQEAEDHLADRTSEDDKSLRAFSDEAMNVALEAMKGFLQEKNRSVVESCEMGSTKEAVLDLPAATALLRAAMDARKMLRRKEKPAALPVQIGKDLFDQPDTPWSFKRPD